MFKDSKEKEVRDKPLIIRFRGEYDYDGLLSMIRGFYKRSFFILQEPKLKYKTSGGAAEVEFKFESERKITHYIKVQLFAEGHLWDVKRHDKGLTTGKLDIRLHSKMILDFKGGFDDAKPSHNWMREKLDAKGTGLQFGDNKVTGEKYLEKLLQKFQSEIKKHLKMECV